MENVGLGLEQEKHRKEELWGMRVVWAQRHRGRKYMRSQGASERPACLDGGCVGQQGYQAG